jgi:nucleoside-diphosphate-sugar epimerase
MSAISIPSIRHFRLTNAIAVRLVADAVMVASALLLGMMLRILWMIDVEGASPSRMLIASFERSYQNSVWVLLLVSLSVFYLSGFYTHGRAYRGRYKALVITQAVSLSYLIFSFLAYFLGDTITVSRGALVPAWALTVVLLIGARLWSTFWRKMVGIEQLLNSAERPHDQIRVVLVIGGAGYIGSALLPQLLSRGYRVRLFDLLLFGTEPIAAVLDHPNLEIIRGDFRQVDLVVEAMRGVDAVIHLGAIVGDPACALDEELTIEVNLMATRMIAEVAKGSGVRRFVFASTCSVYGASDEILDEHSALNPVSLYARSKIASERVLRRMACSAFSPVILRFGTIFGLSGRTRFDLVVNLLTAKAVMEKQITVFGGDQWRPFVHVEDAAAAVVKVLEAPRELAHNEIFNVGSDKLNYTIQQVGELVQRLVPQARLISMGDDSDRRNYRVSFAKIHNRLGFTRHRPLEYGIQQVIDAIRRGQVLDYHEARYSNVKFLSDGTASQLIQRQNGWVNQLLSETYEIDENQLQPLQVRAVGG